MMRTSSVCLIAVISLFVLVLPVYADTPDSQPVKVIYQTAFSTDPRWTTNSPSSDYWDPSKAMYHFSIEPSTGNYAYIPVDNFDGPFTFEYDLILDRIDDGATFRFGLTGSEMDFNKGPNVFTVFSNGKFGRIMWLHLVTPGNKQVEVNSQSDDTETSGSVAYRGPTVKYELNKTYHVTTTYDEELGALTMRVSEKMSGKTVWSYFINTAEAVHGMNHIYLGSRGDYGQMFVYARGYIDNVRLTVPGPAVTPEPTVVSPEETTAPPVTTTKKPLALPTHMAVDTTTPESPTGAFPALLALGVIGTLGILRGCKKP